MNFILRVLPVLLAMLLPSLALAHTGDHGDAALSTGFLHPLSGFDHLLALIAGGIWLAQQPRHNRPIIGGVFIGTLGLSAVAGQYFPGVHFEHAIVATLVCLGALIATAVKMPLLMSLVIFGSIAIVHGFIHSSAGAGNGFGLGLMVSSAVATAFTSHSQRLRVGISTRIVGMVVMLVGIVSAL
jgi:urease accessory protein